MPDLRDQRGRKNVSATAAAARVKDPVRPAANPQSGDGAVPPQLRNRRPARSRRPEGLSTMRRRFVDNYVTTGVIGQSALRAGYSSGVMGTNLLKDPKIQAAIAERRQRAQAKIDEMFSVEAQTVLKEIALIAFSNMGDYFKDWGQRTKTITLPAKKDAPPQTRTIDEHFVIPKNKEELTALQQRCIAEIQLDDTGRTKTFRFKTQDKLHALKLLGSYFGLFEGTGRKVDPSSLVAELRSAAAVAESMFPGNGDQPPLDSGDNSNTEDSADGEIDVG